MLLDSTPATLQPHDLGSRPIEPTTPLLTLQAQRRALRRVPAARLLAQAHVAAP